MDPPGENMKVFLGTMLGVGVSCVIFVLIRLAARPAPSTMNKEWQEATNEYLRVRCSPHNSSGACLTCFCERAVQWRTFLFSADLQNV